MKKKILLMIVLSVVLMLSSVFAISFTDVSESHWAYEAINEMLEKGILNGYPDGTFLPSKHITKAEFAKILVLSLDLNEEDTPTLDEMPYVIEDIEPTFWGYEYINIAINYLPLHEENNKLYFMPNAPINREDVAEAIVRSSGLSHMKYDLNILNKFSDADEITEDKKEYVAIATKKGLMQGNANGTFNPKGYLTRAEVSKLMMNSVNTKLDEDTLFVVEGNEYKIQEYEKFAQILNFENGDINKEMTEDELLIILDEFLLSKIYLIAAEKHNIILESGVIESLENDWSKDSVVLLAKNISKEDYIKYKTEEAIVQKLQVSLGDYYELPDEIYSSVKSMYQGKNLYKTYGFRLMTIPYEVSGTEKDLSRENRLALAEDLASRIKVGENFEELAKKYGSKVATFKENKIVFINGDLEYATTPLLESRLNSEILYNTVIKMNVGDVSEVVENVSHKSFQIIKLESIEEGFVGEGEKELKNVLINQYADDIVVAGINYEINQSAYINLIYGE